MALLPIILSTGMIGMDSDFLETNEILADFLFLDIQRHVITEGYWSGRGDLNPRPHAPEACALPGCATSRFFALTDP